jgi:hypothetical protein
MAVPVLGQVGKQADKVFSNHAKGQANIGRYSRIKIVVHY